VKGGRRTEEQGEVEEEDEDEWICLEDPHAPKETKGKAKKSAETEREWMSLLHFLQFEEKKKEKMVSSPSLPEMTAVRIGFAVSVLLHFGMPL
jgi:hypothetical protein